MSNYAESVFPEGKVLQTKELTKKSVLKTDEVSTILDADWAAGAFLVSSGRLEDIDARNRTFSSVSLKFTDTTLGGNYACNAKPQFTRYSDTRSQGKLSGRQETLLNSWDGNLGMGRYYSEAIDDTSQVIHMRFGVPQYNSLTQFFTGFYNTSAARVARTGRTNDFFNKAGFAIGLVAQIVIWPIAAVAAIGFIGSFFLDRQTSKYYYLKPTMFTYWSAVNSMVNKIAVGKGLFPTILSTQRNQIIGSTYELDKDTLEFLHNLNPNTFSKDGGYDIYATANRAQRMKINADRRTYELFNQGTTSDFEGYVKREGQDKLAPETLGSHSWANAFQQWIKSPSSTATKEETVETDIRGVSQDSKKEKKPSDKNSNVNDQAGYLDYLKTELDDGSAFASFRVDYTGPVSESFSNSVRDSDLSSKVNGISSTARSANFSFAGGNIGGGIIGDAIVGSVKAVGSVVAGVLDSINFSGLIGLKGGAFVDIPKHWDSSSASLPKSTYTMQLVSPYGNVISQMQNIYIPLAMILAAALPLSTGKQSYTSPFILELYDKGRHQTRLGMIDSLSITRGTTNLGFNKANQAMGIEVSFSIVDMSSIMHMQIAKGFLSNDENGIFDEETVFSDYMNSLSSLGLHEQFHRMPKLRLRAARSLRNLQSLTSPAAWASFTKETRVAGLSVGDLEVFFRGTHR